MLLPDHPPEVPKGLREGALSGNVGILTAVAVNIICVNVVTARDACIRRTKVKVRRTEGMSRKKTVEGGREGE